MELEQKAVELIEQLQALAQPAADLALATVQAAAIINIAQGLAAIPVIYLLAKTTRFLAKKCSQASYDSDVPYGIGAIASGIAAAILSVGAFCALFDTGNWLALFSPEMALAYKIIG